MEIVETVVKLIGAGMLMVMFLIIATTALSFWGLMFICAVVYEVLGSFSTPKSSNGKIENPNPLEVRIADVKTVVQGQEVVVQVWYQVTGLGKILALFAIYLDEEDITFDLSDEECDLIFALLEDIDPNVPEEPIAWKTVDSNCPSLSLLEDDDVSQS